MSLREWLNAVRPEDHRQRPVDGGDRAAGAGSYAGAQSYKGGRLGRGGGVKGVIVLVALPEVQSVIDQTTGIEGGLKFLFRTVALAGIASAAWAKIDDARRHLA